VDLCLLIIAIMSLRPQGGPEKSCSRGKEPGDALRAQGDRRPVVRRRPRGEAAGADRPNGAGKTTVFNLMTGVYRSMRSVLLEGNDITAARPRATAFARLARTFPEHPLMAHLSVLGNVMIAQYARSPGVAALLQPIGFGRGNRWRAEAARPRRSGPRELRDQPAGACLMASRSALSSCARLLAAPRVLLLDEPPADESGRDRSAAPALEAIRRARRDPDRRRHDMQFRGAPVPALVVLNFG